jgi:proline-rich protein PRCC
MDDPYPGYYQKPSGEWAAYDPEYYKSFWETWNLKAVSSARDKGKRKERGWEGAEGDDVQSVDAHEEMLKSQLAEMETTKNLTATPSGPPAQPKMNIKVCARTQSLRTCLVF